MGPYQNPMGSYHVMKIATLQSYENQPTMLPWDPTMLPWDPTMLP